jgi:predicted aconitase
MVQSGVPLSMIAEIISAESMSELKEMIKTAEDYMSQLEQQRSEAQGEQMQQAQDRQEAMERLKLDTQIEVAMIGSPDANAEEVKNRLKEREILIKEEIERRKLDLERNKLGETVRSNMADEAIKRVMANRKPTKS